MYCMSFSIILGLCYARRDVVVLSVCVLMFVHNNNVRSSIIIIIFCWFWVVRRICDEQDLDECIYGDGRSLHTY